MAILSIVLPLVAGGSVWAQEKLPSVETLIQQLDRDQDGVLVAKEVESSRYARQFDRWDVNRDGKVTEAEIIEFRANFGIKADGSRMRGGGQDGFAGGTQVDGPMPNIEMLPIPKVADLARVSRANPPTRAVAKISAFVLKTEEHPVAGRNYFVLTDHTEDKFLTALQVLADHHQGQVIKTADLAALSKDELEFQRVQRKLVEGEARWVAVAPRLDSFRESMLLGVWSLFSGLDDDPQIDVYPGLLVAGNEASFVELVEQSIQHTPATREQLKPFAIAQVQSSQELRSLQKAAILRDWFEEIGRSTPIVGVYGKQAEAAPRLEGDAIWNLRVKNKQQFIKTFPREASERLRQANLIVMHGHGIPGMSCSIDNAGLPEDLRGKIVMTGSCFSAAPANSDLPQMQRAPGGFAVKPREAFLLRAVDNGAILSFGHQRLSSGFPHLFPVLEGLLEGKSAGRAYQELLNALIELKDDGDDRFSLPSGQPNRQLPQNRFLYVLIGDPALQAFEPMAVGRHTAEPQ